MLRRLTVVGAVSSLTNWGHHNTDKYSGIQCLSESNEILHSFLSDMIWVCVCAQACFVCVCVHVCVGVYAMLRVSVYPMVSVLLSLEWGY